MSSLLIWGREAWAEGGLGLATGPWGLLPAVGLARPSTSQASVSSEVKKWQHLLHTGCRDIPGGGCRLARVRRGSAARVAAVPFSLRSSGWTSCFWVWRWQDGHHQDMTHNVTFS